MNAFLYFYAAAMLGLWLYAVPAFRAVGARKRLWSAAAFGVVVTFYEIYINFIWGPTVTAPIRIDLFLIVPLLFVAHGVALSGLIHARRRMGLAAGYFVILLIPAVALVGLAKEIWDIQQKSKRLTANFFEANRLLFEARFRDPATFRRYYGELEAPGPPLSGHWRREGEGSPSRMVINAAGTVWAFYLCGDTECLAGKGEARDGIIRYDHHLQSEYMLEAAGVQDNRLTLKQLKPKRDTARATVPQPETLTFIREPPPWVHTEEQPGSLEYVGSYATLKEHKDHIAITEAWLWRAPENLLAVMVHDILLKDSSARFIRPFLFGGSTVNNPAGVYTFEPEHRYDRVHITPPENGRVKVELERDGRTVEALTLNKKEYITDDALMLAPTASAEAWQYWFDTVMTGRFFAWQVPSNADAK